MKTSPIKILSASLITLSLAACSGGDDSNTTTNNNTGLSSLDNGAQNQVQNFGQFSSARSQLDAMMPIDRDRNHKLSAEEIETFSSEIIVEMDTDLDGNISLLEFNEYTQKEERDFIVDEFQDLDADGDGLVKSSELYSIYDEMAYFLAVFPDKLSVSSTQAESSFASKKPNDKYGPHSLDTNSDGSISTEEVQAAVDADLAQFDTDQNQIISLAEFEAVINTEIEQDIAAEFAEIDTNSDSLVDVTELQAIFEEIANIAEAIKSEWSDGSYDAED